MPVISAVFRSVMSLLISATDEDHQAIDALIEIASTDGHPRQLLAAAALRCLRVAAEGGGSLLRLATRWDSARDADEFAAALERNPSDVGARDALSALRPDAAERGLPKLADRADQLAGPLRDLAAERGAATPTLLEARPGRSSSARRKQRGSKRKNTGG